MKVLNTKYNGYYFRSRLEARWAIFMDTLGVKYQYEPEVFDLDDNLYYLPDFYLPELDVYIEIKPVYPTKEEEIKASRLATVTGKDVYIFYGQPENPDNTGEESAFIFSPNLENKDGGWHDNRHWWCECELCHKVGIEYEGRGDRIKCGCFKKGDKGYNFNSDRLISAYNKAKSYRFFK